MLKIGTFRADIKKAIEKQLVDQQDKFEIILLDKKKGILNAQQDEVLEIEALFTTHLSLEELKLLPKLKTILVPMTGLDGLDEQIVDDGKIRIINAHSLAPYIAERGMGILMTLAGRIHTQNISLKKGVWNREGDDGKWLTLRNKKIGIYGYGYIGKEFEKMIRPFSSDIYVINREKEYPKSIHVVKDIGELTKVCDILFIAVPGNSQTQDTINVDEINNLKNGLIVNVGRGKVVNQRALYQGLKNGSLLGYGSDVWYNYPKSKYDLCFPSDEDLSEFDQVVMTPHNAWNHDHSHGLVINEMVNHVKNMLND